MRSEKRVNSYYKSNVSYIFHSSGESVVDPSYIEERVAVAQLTISANQYREICSFHSDYVSHSSSVIDVVPFLSEFTMKYAAELIKQIKDAVTTDVEARYTRTWQNLLQNFKSCIFADITKLEEDQIC